MANFKFINWDLLYGNAYRRQIWRFWFLFS